MRLGKPGRATGSGSLKKLVLEALQSGLPVINGRHAGALRLPCRRRAVMEVRAKRVPQFAFGFRG